MFGAMIRAAIKSSDTAAVETYLSILRSFTLSHYLTRKDSILAYGYELKPALLIDVFIYFYKALGKERAMAFLDSILNKFKFDISTYQDN